MKKMWQLLALLGVLLTLTACASDTGSDRDRREHNQKPGGTLAQLRAEMEPPVMASAYLGYLESEPEGGVTPWLQAKHPDWMEKYSFVADIPAGRVIGTHGSVYCIVPRDADASVEVNRVFIGENGSYPVQEVLYTSEKGDPILILDAMENNTMLQIVITNRNGKGVLAYPEWGSYEATPEGVPEGSQIVDFGPVIPYDVYSSYLQDGWYVPDPTQLANTNWQCDTVWALDLNCESGNADEGGSAYLYWVEDGGVYRTTHTGTWNLTDGYLILDLLPIDESTTEIHDSYRVLLSPEEEPWLWFGRGESGEVMPYMNEDSDGDWLRQPKG